MKNKGIEKSQAHIILEIAEYVTDSVVVRTILKKITGSINVISIAQGGALAENVIPFDNFVQVIDGNAEIVIDGKSSFLNSGQAIIIPAHSKNSVKARERFKMISTIIKSGYE